MMDAIYVFLIRNNEWIYIVCSLGLFWFISQFVRARAMLRRAAYNLERERAGLQRNNALLFILIFGVVLSSVYYVNERVAPTLPPDLLKPPTPTPDIFLTPLASPTPLGTAVYQPSPTFDLVPTITLASSDVNNPPPVGPVEAETPTSPDAPDSGATDIPPIPAGPTPTPFIGCNVLLNITDPRNGSVVDGAISFFGTANTENFGFYRLEANGPQTSGSWASLLGRDLNQSVSDNSLGTVNLSQWSNGPYLIKLSSYDRNSNLTGECVIQITLAN